MSNIWTIELTYISEIPILTRPAEPESTSKMVVLQNI